MSIREPTGVEHLRAGAPHNADDLAEIARLKGDVDGLNREAQWHSNEADRYLARAEAAERFLRAAGDFISLFDPADPDDPGSTDTIATWPLAKIEQFAIGTRQQRLDCREWWNSKDGPRAALAGGG